MILRIHIDVQKVERLGARLSWRSSLGRFGEISTAPQPRSRIPSLCKSAKRPIRRSSAPTGERAPSASRASPDGSAQPTTIPDLGICGLRPTGAAIRKVDKAVARFVEEPRSQHPGRALTGGRSERIIHLKVDHWPRHYSHCFQRFLQNGELRSNSGATPSLVLYPGYRSFRNDSTT
jgi:hypothetical protein